VYTSLGMYLGTMAGIHLPGYVASLYTLGIPSILHADHWYHGQHAVRHGAGQRSPGLYPRINIDNVAHRALPSS